MGKGLSAVPLLKEGERRGAVPIEGKGFGVVSVSPSMINHISE